MSPAIPKERGLLAIPSMALALRRELTPKTQTRRLAKFVALREGLNFGFSGLSADLAFTGVPSSGHVLYSRGGGSTWEQVTAPLHCPYGSVGDRLYVKETYALLSQYDHLSPSKAPRGSRVWYLADGPKPPEFGRTRVSIHMPRWASRTVLEITEVRVERVRNISLADIRAEGWPGVFVVFDDKDAQLRAARVWWQELWTRINGAESWERNDWVWVIGLRWVTP